MDKNTSEFIEKIYYEKYANLYSYAYAKLKNRELAEEAVQEVFRIACAKPQKLISSPNHYGWLLETLKYVIKNMERSHIRYSKLVLKTIVEDGENSSVHIDEDVDVLYGDLADNESFKLIKKYAVEKHSVSQMAKELGITLDACKKRLSRAKAEIRRKIKKD